MDKFLTNLTGILFLFFFITFTHVFLAQQVKIKRIIDSNLFELTDGRIIKLAGVDVPNITSANLNNFRIAKQAKKYSNDILLNKVFNFKEIISIPKTSLFTLGILSRDFPTETIEYNLLFLLKGFGKFISDIDTLDAKKYLLAEKEAKRNREGIWAISTNYGNDTLDSFISGKPYRHFLNRQPAVFSTLEKKEKIVKIIDSNIFELADGSFIKLANVDVPNINHRDPLLKKIGRNAYKFAKSMLLDKKFDFAYVQNNVIDTNYSLVYLLAENTFYNKDFSEEYLQQGFGKFTNNSEDTDTKKYRIAEDEACKKRVGVWKFGNTYNSITLDQSFINEKLFSAEGMDSLAQLSQSKSLLLSNNFSESILLQTIIAPLTGAFSAFITGLGSYGLGTFLFSNHYEGILLAENSIFIGALLGYTVGNALAVYQIAKDGNNDVNLGNTIFSSFIGAGISYATLNNTPKDYNDLNLNNYSPLILPVLASIIYANFIAPQKVVKQNGSQSSMNNINLIENKLTHRDLYNSTKLLEVNLFKIDF
ncbi:MAG: hypothetical protein GY936_00040 [Ignavibacteriae bacterium]|nr:hypothetical protein [Ignavibacteriota bacterium]